MEGGGWIPLALVSLRFLLMEGRSPCRRTFSLNYVAGVNRTAKMLCSHGTSDEVSSFYDVRLCSFWSWLFDRFILRQVFYLCVLFSGCGYVVDMGHCNGARDSSPM